MSSPNNYYSQEECARRGDEIYARIIQPRITAEDEGKFVVIDVETEAYEIDQDEIAASDRLIVHTPNAQMWLMRIGSRYTHHRRVRP